MLILVFYIFANFVGQPNNKLILHMIPLLILSSIIWSCVHCGWKKNTQLTEPITLYYVVQNTTITRPCVKKKREENSTTISCRWTIKDISCCMLSQAEPVPINMVNSPLLVSVPHCKNGCRTPPVRQIMMTQTGLQNVANTDM